MEIWDVLQAIGSVVWLTVVSSEGKLALLAGVAAVSVVTGRLLTAVGAAWLAAAVSIPAGYVYAFLAYLLAGLAPVGGAFALFLGWLLAFPTAFVAILVDRYWRRRAKAAGRLDA